MTAGMPRPKLAQALRAMDEEFVRNANSGNVEALVSAFYAEDAELLPPGAPLMRGHEEIKECWKGMVSAGLNIAVWRPGVSESPASSPTRQAFMS